MLYTIILLHTFIVAFHLKIIFCSPSRHRSCYFRSLQFIFFRKSLLYFLSIILLENIIQLNINYNIIHNFLYKISIIFNYFRNHDKDNSRNIQDSLEKCKDAEKKKTHIKKPLNAFMLYMKEMRAKVVAECTLKESAAINQILGRRVRLYILIV